MSFRWKLLLANLALVVSLLVLSYVWTVPWLQDSGIEDISTRLDQALLYRLLFLILLGGTLTFLISRRLTRSIDALNTAARRISTGDFVTSIPVSSHDELGRLARTLEETSRQLEHQMQRLQSERSYLNTILNSMSEGVLVADERGRVVETNPAFRYIFRLTSDEKGKSPLEIVRNAKISKGITTVLQREDQHVEEIRSERKILLARFAPLRMNQKVLGVVAVFHDITEIRRLENIRKEFVSNVSHELKTPLTSIRGYAETLMNEERLDSVHREFTRKIYRNATQLSEMIGELFGLARLEGGEQPLERKPVSFQTLMSELEREYGSRMKEKQILFYARNRSGADLFPAGEAYLRRVFHNLIDNALKYTDQGSVEVEMQAHERGFLFRVQDTGIGIPPQDLDRIFERFYRVHKDRSRQTGGSGIGLAIVKHVIQLHGGQVWAESEVGKGTSVLFTLPA